MIEAIDHIGIAVRSLAASVPRYEQLLGVSCSGIETVEAQGVKTAFFVVGGSRVELLEGTSATSPISRFVEKRGEGLHHIAFRSSSFEPDLRRVIEGGCEQVAGISSEGAEGSRVAFLHPRGLNGVLVEICTPAERRH